MSTKASSKQTSRYYWFRLLFGKIVVHVGNVDIIEEFEDVIKGAVGVDILIIMLKMTGQKTHIV